METRFASPERETINAVEQEHSYVKSAEIFKSIVDLMPQNFLVVNDHRQIVYGNRSILQMLECSESEIIGKRPGEVFHCVHSDEMEGGCGTAEACRTCGAVDAVLKAFKGKEVLQECRVLTHSGHTLNLKIWALPIRILERDYVILICFDIGDEKMRKALERIFFHDVLNTAGGIHGYSMKLTREKEKLPEEARDSISILYKLVSRMIGEIKAYKQIVAAEQSRLPVREDIVNTGELLEELAVLYRNHEVSGNRRVLIAEESEIHRIHTDESLLHRILSNMVKNALEASGRWDTVTIGCIRRGDSIEFHVHNPSFIPLDIQQQIFQRSFSTKGEGRGLGTYSMKLLSRRYLNGDVNFTSSREKGTVFTATYPYEPAEEGRRENHRETETPLSAADQRTEEIEILVVDDNEINCEIVRYILEERGYRITTVLSAEEALSLLGQNRYRMILMDIHMPGMDGLQAFRMIRSDPELDRIPVIAISADDQEAGEDARIAAMDGRISKPFDAERMIAEVEKWLGKET